MMKTILMITLATKIISSHCQDSNNWEEFPLTDTEVKLIKEESGSKSRIELKNNQNQTCVLTPGTSSSGSCTWRSQRQCKQVPTVTKVPVFSPWCSDHGDAGHLANCHETVTRRPLVHSVRVCTPTGAPDCRGPCYQCPEYCEPVQQSWCEVSHSISTVVMEKTDCDYNNDQGKCNQVVKRIEKDMVTQNENCYQKAAEICGPANCKFVNKSMECHEKNSSVLADLRQRECTICQPSLADRVEVLDICDDILTHDCETDPLPRLWKKLCDTDKSQIFSNGIVFKFDENKDKNISVQDLVQQSLEPVQSLLSQTLLQIRGGIDEIGDNPTTTTKIFTTSSPPTTKVAKVATTTTESSLNDEAKEDVSDILNLLNLRQSTLRTRQPEENIFFVPSSEVPAPVTSEPAPASVYFDPVLNTVNTQLVPASTQSSSTRLPEDPANMNQNKSPSSLTEFLNFQLEHQFSEKTSTAASTSTTASATAQDRETTKFAKTTTLITSSSGIPAQNTAANVETSTKTTQTKIKIIATTSVTTTSTTTTTTTTTSTTTSTTTTTTSTTTTTTRKTSTTTTTTDKPTSISSSDTKHKMQLSPADFLRLCFVSQIGCDFSHNEIQEVEEEATQTTTVGPTSSTPDSEAVSRRPKELSKEKEEKLRQMIRNCFLNGICDGSNYSSEDKGTNFPRPTTPRTVAETPITETLSYREQEIQRRVRERARACFFEGVCN